VIETGNDENVHNVSFRPGENKRPEKTGKASEAEGKVRGYGRIGPGREMTTPLRADYGQETRADGGKQVTRNPTRSSPWQPPSVVSGNAGNPVYRTKL
jgi:hypothetical protein